MKQLGAKKSLFRGEEQVAELGGKAVSDAFFVAADGGVLDVENGFGVLAVEADGIAGGDELLAVVEGVAFLLKQGEDLSLIHI